ncbi:MAG: type VII toxin-antitoxin system HepT family RNase toxin [bacterium]
MLNARSIIARLERLDECVTRLKELGRRSLEEYLNDPVVQAATERLFQVGVEACVDIAAHIISAFGLKRPAERKDVFSVLCDSGYLERDLSEIMIKMVKLRNRLVHLYWDVDPEKMYGYLREDVGHFERFKAFAVGILEGAGG